MEIIRSIKSLDDFKLKLAQSDYESSYEGFEIVTDRQRILFGISNQNCCCESWGHLSSEDNLDYFVGSALLGIKQTDEALKTHDVLDEAGVIFVTFDTSKGPLQFAVYNAHNGYYGHAVRLVSEQLQIDDTV